MGGLLAGILDANAAILRPFRQRIDLETVILLFVLTAALAGGWHLVLETVELGGEESSGDTET